jgi:hypothetical protein
MAGRDGRAGWVMVGRPDEQAGR